MQGVLFKYGPGSAHVAFRSPATAKHPHCHGQLHLVLVGGLTDGLLFAPYCQKLAEAVGGLGWQLVQAQLTSSYQGWGLASLDQDAAELRLLSKCLAEQHGCSAWVLMGHSTGCQDAVRYVSRHRSEDDMLKGVILQAPVSDREYLSMYPSWAKLVEPAQQMMAAGKGEEVLCRATEFDGAAVSARRFLSLYCPGGDDDMFSTDLTLQQLQEIVGPLKGLPCCILQSASDEAVPAALRENGTATELGRRMAKAIQLGVAKSNDQAGSMLRDRTAAGGCGVSSTTTADTSGLLGSAAVDVSPQLHVVPGAGHACAGHEDEVASLVCTFLEGLDM